MKHSHQTAKHTHVKTNDAMRARMIIAGLALLTGSAGCAGLPDDRTAMKSVEVERVDSRYAHIENVQVQAVDSDLKISGHVRKTLQRRGFIPGHLHIEVLDMNGEQLSETTSRYQRRSTKSHRARFSTTLPLSQGKARTVRVIHHAFSSKPC